MRILANVLFNYVNRKKNVCIAAMCKTACIPANITKGQGRMLSVHCNGIATSKLDLHCNGLKILLYHVMYLECILI
jgi:hypothetical protein